VTACRRSFFGAAGRIRTADLILTKGDGPADHLSTLYPLKTQALLAPTLLERFYFAVLDRIPFQIYYITFSVKETSPFE